MYPDTEDAGDRTNRLANEVSLLRAQLASGNRIKAAAIMGGHTPDYIADADGNGFLKAVLDARRGDGPANEYVKAVLGTSAATGQAIIPNNFVADVTEIAAIANPYRDLMTVIGPIIGKGVDIPYEVTGHSAALLQGAYGSNKDIRDFTLGTVTATLYAIAEIIDIGNQFLRQSGGAAEQLARHRLGKAFGLAEANFILNGTGTNQPRGILQAFLDYGGTAFTTAKGSEPRAATIGTALGAVEARNQRATAISMNPTTFWSLATEGLGTSYAGGWALEPAAGPAGDNPTLSLWGIPVVRDANLTAGTALVGNFRECQLFFGQEYTIDVSSEAGTRFDQNVTGFRAEEEMAFDARPYVLSGYFQKVTGL
jgi:HK97 family phage major capsid protein